MEIEVIPGLNMLALAGVALFIPLFSALALSLGNILNTKDTK